MLTSRQMAKSSLMVRTAMKLREQGMRVIALDLTAVGQNLEPEQWYHGLLDSIGAQLDLDDELEQFWEANGDLGPLQRLMKALRIVVLPKLSVGAAGVRVEEQPSGDGPRTADRLVIFVDEIDIVRSLPFSTDEFFAAIRECYNRRNEDREFNRLTFCLLGVATPSDLIRDTRLTPFNIGHRIELNDFTEQEVAPLATGLQVGKWERAARLQRILYWTNGHPYLTQSLCRATLKELEEDSDRGAAAAEPNAGAEKGTGAARVHHANTRQGTPRVKSFVDALCKKLFLTPHARECDDNLLFVRDRLHYPCRFPAYLSSTNAEDFTAVHRVSRLMLLEGELHETRGAWGEAVRSYLDVVQLGGDVSHGSQGFGATSIFAGVPVRLARLIPRLDEGACRGIITNLADLRRNFTTFPELLRGIKLQSEVEMLELFQHANWRRELLGTHEFTRDEVLIHPLDALVQASIELAQVWLHSWTRSKRDVLDDSSRYFDRCLAITAGLPPVQSAFPAVPKEVARVSDTSWTLLWQWQEHLRLTAQLRLLEAAAGLQAFHAAHGQWPSSLDELVPGYLDQVPADPFSPNQSLRYQRVEGRIILHSVGPDGTDDGGSLDASRFNNWQGDIMLPNLDWKSEPPSQDN